MRFIRERSLVAPQDLPGVVREVKQPKQRTSATWMSKGEIFLPSAADAASKARLAAFCVVSITSGSPSTYRLSAATSTLNTYWERACDMARCDFGPTQVATRCDWTSGTAVTTRIATKRKRRRDENWTSASRQQTSTASLIDLPSCFSPSSETSTSAAPPSDTWLQSLVFSHGFSSSLPCLRVAKYH